MEKKLLTKIATNLLYCFFFLLPYEREIWHYEKASTDLIHRSIDQFPWDNRFSNLDVNQKVHLFN